MDNIGYPWLQAYWDKLSRYQQQDRLPSALMLVGDKALGLSAFATAFSQRTICLSLTTSGMACGVCESCLLFNAGNYPDFFHIKPEDGKKSIKIDVIRGLIESLALSNQYAKPRMVIIDPADALLHQASNSLLKTLEEPSDNTCLVLIAEKASKISATIRSRCQLITVKDIDLSKATLWLEAEGCNQAEQYLNLANHLPLLAYDLWKKEALTVRVGIFRDFMAMLNGQLDPLLFAEKCIGLKNLPALKWIMSWLTDAVKVESNVKNLHLINPDLKDDLKVLVEKLHLKNIHDLLDKLAQLINLESSQLNQQLLLEDFAIECYSLTIKRKV
ncbi:MAG: DNA polymerase III subunit delta' C-terminal domain-containing protein [Cycloclasticus sp.]